MKNAKGIRIDVYFGDKRGSSHYIYSCTIPETMVSGTMYHEDDVEPFINTVIASLENTDANTEDDLQAFIISTNIYLSEMNLSSGFVIKVSNL